jgi:hypothetical protein
MDDKRGGTLYISAIGRTTGTTGYIKFLQSIASLRFKKGRVLSFQSASSKSRVPSACQFQTEDSGWLEDNLFWRGNIEAS